MRTESDRVHDDPMSPSSTRTPGPPAQRRASARTHAVVDALVGAGLLEAARRDPALGVVGDVLDGTDREPGSRRWLSEVSGYLGGAFVLAAASLFFVESWDGLGVGVQIGLLVVICVALGVIGTVVRSTAAPHGGADGDRPDDVRRRLAATLFAGATVSGAGAMGLVVDRLDGEDWGNWPGAGFALTLLVLGVVGYLGAPTVLGQLVIAWGAVQSVGMLVFGDLVVELDGTAELLAFAIAIGAVGVGWLVLAEARRWHERLAARLIGCALVAIAVQWPIFSEDPEIAYAFSALAAVAAFVVYVRVHAWPYLVLGVGLITVVVPEALLDWTDGTLGVAGVLLVGGLVLLGGSVIGLRVHRDLAEDDATG